MNDNTVLRSYSIKVSTDLDNLEKQLKSAKKMLKDTLDGNDIGDGIKSQIEELSAKTDEMTKKLDSSVSGIQKAVEKTGKSTVGEVEKIQKSISETVNTLSTGIDGLITAIDTLNKSGGLSNLQSGINDTMNGIKSSLDEVMKGFADFKTFVTDFRVGAIQQPDPTKDIKKNTEKLKKAVSEQNKVVESATKKKASNQEKSQLEEMLRDYVKERENISKIIDGTAEPDIAAFEKLQGLLTNILKLVDKIDKESSDKVFGYESFNTVSIDTIRKQAKTITNTINQAYDDARKEVEGKSPDIYLRWKTEINPDETAEDIYNKIDEKYTQPIQKKLDKKKLKLGVEPDRVNMNSQIRDLVKTTNEDLKKPDAPKIRIQTGLQDIDKSEIEAASKQFQSALNVSGDVTTNIKGGTVTVDNKNLATESTLGQIRDVLVDWQSSGVPGGTNKGGSATSKASTGALVQVANARDQIKAGRHFNFTGSSDQLLKDRNEWLRQEQYVRDRLTRYEKLQNKIKKIRKNEERSKWDELINKEIETSDLWKDTIKVGDKEFARWSGTAKHEQILIDDFRKKLKDEIYNTEEDAFNTTIKGIRAKLRARVENLGLIGVELDSKGKIVGKNKTEFERSQVYDHANKEVAKLQEEMLSSGFEEEYEIYNLLVKRRDVIQQIVEISKKNPEDERLITLGEELKVMTLQVNNQEEFNKLVKEREGIEEKRRTSKNGISNKDFTRLIKIQSEMDNMFEQVAPDIIQYANEQMDTAEEAVNIQKLVVSDFKRKFRKKANEIYGNFSKEHEQYVTDRWKDRSGQTKERRVSVRIKDDDNYKEKLEEFKNLSKEFAILEKSITRIGENGEKTYDYSALLPAEKERLNTLYNIVPALGRELDVYRKINNIVEETTKSSKKLEGVTTTTSNELTSILAPIRSLTSGKDAKGNDVGLSEHEAIKQLSDDQLNTMLSSLNGVVESNIKDSDKDLQKESKRYIHERISFLETYIKDINKTIGDIEVEGKDVPTKLIEQRDNAQRDLDALNTFKNEAVERRNIYKTLKDEVKLEDTKINKLRTTLRLLGQIATEGYVINYNQDIVDTKTKPGDRDIEIKKKKASAKITESSTTIAGYVSNIKDVFGISEEKWSTLDKNGSKTDLAKTVLSQMQNGNVVKNIVALIADGVKDIDREKVATLIETLFANEMANIAGYNTMKNVMSTKANRVTQNGIAQTYVNTIEAELARRRRESDKAEKNGSTRYQESITPVAKWVGDKDDSTDRKLVNMSDEKKREYSSSRQISALIKKEENAITQNEESLSKIENELLELRKKEIETTELKTKEYYDKEIESLQKLKEQKLDELKKQEEILSKMETEYAKISDQNIKERETKDISISRKNFDTYKDNTTKEIYHINEQIEKMNGLSTLSGNSSASDMFSKYDEFLNKEKEINKIIQEQESYEKKNIIDIKNKIELNKEYINELKNGLVPIKQVGVDEKNNPIYEKLTQEEINDRILKTEKEISDNKKQLVANQRQYNKLLSTNQKNIKKIEGDQNKSLGIRTNQQLMISSFNQQSTLLNQFKAKEKEYKTSLGAFGKDDNSTKKLAKELIGIRNKYIEVALQYLSYGGNKDDLSKEFYSIMDTTSPLESMLNENIQRLETKKHEVELEKQNHEMEKESLNDDLKRYKELEKQKREEKKRIEILMATTGLTREILQEEYKLATTAKSKRKKNDSTVISYTNNNRVDKDMTDEQKIASFAVDRALQKANDILELRNQAVKRLSQHEQLGDAEGAEHAKNAIEEFDNQLNIYAEAINQAQKDARKAGLKISNITGRAILDNSKKDTLLSDKNWYADVKGFFEPDEDVDKLADELINQVVAEKLRQTKTEADQIRQKAVDERIEKYLVGMTDDERALHKELSDANGKLIEMYRNKTQYTNDEINEQKEVIEEIKNRVKASSRLELGGKGNLKYVMLKSEYRPNTTETKEVDSTLPATEKTLSEIKDILVNKFGGSPSGGSSNGNGGNGNRKDNALIDFSKMTDKLWDEFYKLAESKGIKVNTGKNGGRYISKKDDQLAIRKEFLKLHPELAKTFSGNNNKRNASNAYKNSPNYINWKKMNDELWNEYFKLAEKEKVKVVDTKNGRRKIEDKKDKEKINAAFLKLHPELGNSSATNESIKAAKENKKATEDATKATKESTDAKKEEKKETEKVTKANKESKKATEEKAKTEKKTTETKKKSGSKTKSDEDKKKEEDESKFLEKYYKKAESIGVLKKNADGSKFVDVADRGKVYIAMEKDKPGSSGRSKEQLDAYRKAIEKTTQAEKELTKEEQKDTTPATKKKTKAKKDQADATKEATAAEKELTKEESKDTTAKKKNDTAKENTKSISKKNILLGLNKLLTPTMVESSNNIRAFNDSVGNIFGENKDFENALRKNLALWFKVFSGKLPTISNYSAISGTTDEEFVNRHNIVAEKLGYKINWSTDEQGYLHGVVEKAKNVVKSLDEIFDRFFEIDKLLSKYNIKDTNSIGTQSSKNIKNIELTNFRNNMPTMNDELKNAISSTITDIEDQIINGVISSGEGLNALRSKIFDVMFSNDGSHNYSVKYNDTGKQAVDQFTESLKDGKKEIQNVAKEDAKAVPEEFEEELKIKSPSKVMYELGFWTGKGFENGLLDSLDDIKKTIIEKLKVGAISEDDLKLLSNKDAWANDEEFLKVKKKPTSTKAFRVMSSIDTTGFYDIAQEELKQEKYSNIFDKMLFDKNNNIKSVTSIRSFINKNMNDVLSAIDYYKTSIESATGKVPSIEDIVNYIFGEKGADTKKADKVVSVFDDLVNNAVTKFENNMQKLQKLKIKNMQGKATDSDIVEMKKIKAENETYTKYIGQTEIDNINKKYKVHEDVLGENTKKQLEFLRGLEKTDEELKKQIELLNQEEQSLNNDAESGNLINKDRLKSFQTRTSELHKLTQSPTQFISGFTPRESESVANMLRNMKGIRKESIVISNDGRNIVGTIEKAKGQLQTIEYKWNDILGVYTQSTKVLTTQLSLWDRLKIQAKKSWEYFKSYFGGYLSAQRLISTIRQGISYVKELDKALTEMRKVSDETVESLKRFQAQSFATASEIGTTAASIQNSAADFMRLGYSLKDASELAQHANIYANVGDMEIGEATEHMISSIQAWQSEFESATEASISIIDKYNKIGNSYAITSADIGSAMERSAAALKTAGNTLDESIGLITAGNLIQQDADTTANALKVMSLRIRGSKADLADMGEETDNLASSTSKLRSELKALTGVDIMLDDETYKSTAQIIQEIGAVWDKLSNISQATVLEKLAGKTRASTVAGLIENYKVISEVASDAADSEGSALEENEKYIDSIEGRLNQLTNQVQAFWSSVLDSDTLKELIRDLTSLLGLLTELSKVSLPGVLGIAYGLKSGISNKGFFRSFTVKDENGVDHKQYGSLFSERAADPQNASIKEELKAQKAIKRQGVESIKKYVSLLDKGVEKNDAFAQSFDNVDDAVMKYALDNEDNNHILEDFKNQQDATIESLKKSSKEFSLSTSIINSFKGALASLGSALITGLLSLGVEKLISIIHNFIVLDEQIKEVAATAGEAMKQFEKQTDDYKKNIEELRKTINDETKSNKDRVAAGNELVKLQDDMLEYYKDVPGYIDLVTRAINGEVSALEELKRAEFEQKEEEVNSKGGKVANVKNWIQGYDNNTERLMDKYWNKNVVFDFNEHGIDASKLTDETVKALEKAGAKIQVKTYTGGARDFNWDTDTVTGNYDLQMVVDGDVDEILNVLNDIGDVTSLDNELFGEMNIFLDRMVEHFSDLNKEYSKNKDYLRDQIYYNKILNDPELQDAYLLQEEMADKYREAKATANQEEIDAALKDYEDAENKFINLASDEREKKWIIGLHPEIHTELKNKEERDFVKDYFKDLDKSIFGDRTAEEIELMYHQLNKEVAKKLYGDDSFRDLYNAYKDEISTAIKQGVLDSDFNLSDIIANAKNGNFDDNNRDFYNKITPIINSIESALKEQGINISLSDLIDIYDNEKMYNALNDIAPKVKDITKTLVDNGIVADKVDKSVTDLTSDMVDSAKSAKDQIESLSQTLEKLRAGNLKSGDLIAFLSDDANSEFIKSADNLESAIVERMKSIRQGAIDSVKDLPDDLRQYWTDVVNKAFDYDEATSKINEANASLDKLQEGMKTLSSAFEEYNENGFITLDTLQSLMAENGEYIQMLTIENGQLKINEDGYKNIMAAKLNDFKATLDKAAAAEINALAEENAESKTRSNIQALNEETIAYSENTREAIKNATEKGVSSDDINNIINKYDTIWKTALKGYNKNFRQFSGAADSSAKDAQARAKELLDNYIAVQDALLDAGKISFQEYCTNVKGKLDDMYNSGKLSAKDYYDSVKTFLEKQQSIYDKILNSVTRRFDKEIEGIDKQITAINKENEALDKQKEEYDKILSVVQEVYDNEIKSLNDQKDAIQEKIDALRDANDEEDRALALANARYALEKAQQQRTRLVYSGEQGFVYKQDEEAIRSAKKELKQAELDNTISLLEKEQEALDKDIEKLEEYKEKWSEVSDTYDKEVNRQLAIQMFGENYEQIILNSREQDIKSFTNKYVELQKKQNDNSEFIKSLEEKKEYYEDLKKQWQDVTSVYEQSLEDQLTAQYLGANWEKDILENRTGVLEKFKNDYISIQEQIRLAAIASAEAQERAASASGGSGFDKKITSESNEIKTFAIVDDPENGVKIFNSREDAENYIKSEFSRATINGDKEYAKKLSTGYLKAKEVVSTDVHGYSVVDEKTDPHHRLVVKQFDNYDEASKYIEDNKKTKKWVIRMFSKGGVISANSNKSPLTELANRFGEDTPILAKHGERILTPVQNKYWEKWTNALPNLTKNIDALKFNLPNFGSILGAIANKETTVKQEISISLPNVTNTSGAEYVLNALKTLPLEAVQRVNRR